MRYNRLGLRPDTTRPQIMNKAEFYALSRRGQFGNRLAQFLAWDFLDDFLWLPELDLREKYGERVSVRATRTGSPAQRAGMTLKQAYHHVNDVCVKYRIDVNDLFVDTSAPDDRITLQGEAMRDEQYVYLRYNRVPGLRMREAYPTMQHARGLTAWALINAFMDNNSLTTLGCIWDVYPDAVVEFSCYDCRVGILHWNTLFWEVRTGY